VRRLGICACAVVALSAAVSWSASARVPAPLQLLRTYAPRLVLNSSERFRPVPVDGFIADSDVIGGHYDQRLCSSIDGPAALDCYAAADQAHAAQPVVYGAVFPGATRTVLEYWVFYTFDLYQVSTAPPLDQFWQDHEADWEAVAVVLDSARKPLFVGTSRHCSGARRVWSKVRKRGAHPVVYVALGSHANYFGPGEIPLDKRCWPPVALAIYKAYKVPLRDHVAGGVTVAPQVVQVTATTPSWMTFPGAWGEKQYVHFPSNAPFAFGFGPKGPAFHALWTQPLATVTAWPPG
jgi:hypothetical protein